MIKSCNDGEKRYLNQDNVRILKCNGYSANLSVVVYNSGYHQVAKLRKVC